MLLTAEFPRQVFPVSTDPQSQRLPVRPDQASDAELVRRCLQDETRCFQVLYQRHQQRVRSILYQLCGATQLDDLVQDVFMRAWKGLPKFQQTAQFSTWLYRIAWNVASDQRRSFAQLRARFQILAKVTPMHHEDPDVMRIHYQDVLQEGLAHLSLEHRTVLVLHDLEEQPQKEIAEILGIPVGTVKSRLFHARGALRTFLQQRGINP